MSARDTQRESAVYTETAACRTAAVAGVAYACTDGASAAGAAACEDADVVEHRDARARHCHDQSCHKEAGARHSNL